MHNFKSGQTPGRSLQAFKTSFPLPCSLLLRCKHLPSASKMFCFDLAALYRAMGEMATADTCTGIKQKVIRQTAIWALLSSQEATKELEKFILGESYQTNSILSYWTKIENLDSRCFWLTQRLLCWRFQGRRIVKRSSFNSFMMCMCLFQLEQALYLKLKNYTGFVLTQFAYVNQCQHSKIRDHQTTNSAEKTKTSISVVKSFFIVTNIHMNKIPSTCNVSG